jgi:membrane fusion protein (multidrug efflux system)
MVPSVATGLEYRRTGFHTQERHMAVAVKKCGGEVALLAVLVLAGCGLQDADGADEAAPATGRVLNVELVVVEPRDFSEAIRLSGTVEADREVLVSAEESGVVTAVLVKKGSQVSEGQPLLRIDDRLLSSQVAQATAQAALAGELWTRRRRLFEEDRVGSELAYLEAKYQAQQADAALATLQRRLERTVVLAPIKGVLNDRMVEVGTMVNPGTPVARIVDIDPVKVAAGVPERYASDIRTGSRATVTFDALDAQSFAATIGFVGAVVNRSNRTFPVADVEVVRRVVSAALVVPRDAIVRVEAGYSAFVVVDQGGVEIVESRSVTLGPSQGNEVVISTGLRAGDRLVVVGHKQVATGDRVRVVGGPLEPANPNGALGVGARGADSER